MQHEFIGRDGRRAPLWCWLVLGWALAWGAERFWQTLAPPLVATSADVAPGWPAFDPAWDLDVMGPRQLRALPEIGQTRALGLARERWRGGETDAPDEADGVARFDPEVVPGIGLATQRTVVRAAGVRDPFVSPLDLPPAPWLRR